MNFDFSKFFAWIVLICASIFTIFLMVFSIKIFAYLFLQMLKFWDHA